MSATARRTTGAASAISPLRPTQVASLLLGLGLTGGAWLLTGSTMLAAGVAGVALALVAIHLRPSAVELVAIAMAVSFYVPDPIRINLSLVDLVVPALLVARLTMPNAPELSRAEKWVAGACAAIVASIIMSGFLAALSGKPFEDGRFLVDGAKIAVVAAVAVIVVRPLGRELMNGSVRFAHFWVVTACTLALAAVVTGLGLLPLLPQDNTGRNRGLFEDANLFAAYLIVSLMIASMSRVARGRRALGWEHVVLLAGVASTGSRGAAVAIAVGACVFVVWSDVGQKIRVLSGAAVAVVLIMSSGRLHQLGGIDRLLRTTSDTEGDVRFQLWGVAWRLWKENPVGGVGLGQFPVASSTYNPNQFVAHSTFLSFLAETGPVGLAAIALPLVAVMLWCVRHRRHPLAASWLAGWAAVVVMMCTVNLQNARFVWFAAVLSALLAVVPSQLWLPDGQPVLEEEPRQPVSTGDNSTSPNLEAMVPEGRARDAAIAK